MGRLGAGGLRRARLGRARRGWQGLGGGARMRPGRGGRGQAWKGKARRGQVQNTTSASAATGALVSTQPERGLVVARSSVALAKPEDEAMPRRFGVELPYTMRLRLRGVMPLLFNRMDIEAYDAEGGPGKKRKPRARPEYESMVWRGDDGKLAIPTANVIASIVEAGRYFASPIASSGGATTTLRDALVAATELSSFGVDSWDCIDFRQARFGDRNRNPKPTYRPRLEPGWTVEAHITVVLPELYGPARLLEIVSRAGSVCGIGDGRKIGMGRYVTDGHEVDSGLPWEQ